MIRPLRVRHRRVVLTLAIVTPLLFAAGLATRRPIPLSTDGATPPEADRHRDAEIVDRDESAWGDLPILTDWLGGPGAAVRLEVTEPLRQPDLLLYWDPEPAGDRLSDSALLLGPVGGRRRASWDVPAPVEGGRLVLYSLGHGEIVASAAPPPAWTVRP